MTIKDIARLAGVSVSTVSRVLNNHPDVSAPIRAQVLAVVEDHHFIPNTAARKLVRPRGNAIGVIRSSSNPCYPPILSAIESELSRLGYSMCMRQIHHRDDALTYAAHLERAERLRGVILLGDRFDYTAEMAAPLSVPFVCCTNTNLFGDLPQDRYSSVTIDNEGAAYRAVEFLYRMGHRSIALLLPATDDRSLSELRFHGYCHALETFDLPFEASLVRLCGSYRLADAYRAALALVDSGAAFTALFAVSDLLATAAIRALHEKGLHVPRDCSVMGMDGLELTEYILPPLTTLVPPTAELGRQSVQLLDGLLEGGGEHRHILLETDFRAGASVAPPPW